MSYLDSLSSAVDKKLEEVKGGVAPSSAQGEPSPSPHGAPSPRGGGPLTSHSDRAGISGPYKFGGPHFVELMGGFQQVGKSWSNINAPVPIGDGTQTRPPTEAEVTARTLRATQQSVNSLLAVINAPQDMLNMGFANL